MTPAGIMERYDDGYAQPGLSFQQEIDAGEALETAIEYRHPAASRKVRGSDIGTVSVCMQWEYIHPEIPLMAVIVEVVAMKPGGPQGWTQDVWRTGAHYIVKDSHANSGGTFWRTSFELQKIGPTIVEDATCHTMFMPLHPAWGCRYSPDTFGEA